MSFNPFGNPLVTEFLPQVALAGISAPKGYKTKRQQGHSPIYSLLGTAGETISTASLSLAGGVLLPLAATGTIAGYHAAVNRSNLINRAAQPFSHREEHSEQAGQMQSYGLSQMGAMEGLGNEAAALFGRYGK